MYRTKIYDKIFLNSFIRKIFQRKQITNVGGFKFFGMQLGKVWKIIQLFMQGHILCCRNTQLGI